LILKSLRHYRLTIDQKAIFVPNSIVLRQHIFQTPIHQIRDLFPDVKKSPLPNHSTNLLHKRILISLNTLYPFRPFKFPSINRVLFIPCFKQFPIFLRNATMSRIRPIYIKINPGNIPTDFRSRFSFSILNFHITGSKLTIFPGDQCKAVIGS